MKRVPEDSATRRAFVRTACLAGLGGCAWSMIPRPAGAHTRAAAAAPPDDLPRAWIAAYPSDAGVVLVDENKDHCVCPLVGPRRDPSLGVLCYCSEGFAERMFAAVTGARARAEVTTSILRGDDRCRYRVQLCAPAQRDGAIDDRVGK